MSDYCAAFYMQQQIAGLRSEIDQRKKDEVVDEITGSDYFKSLKEKTSELRDRKGQDEDDNIDNKDENLQVILLRCCPTYLTIARHEIGVCHFTTIERSSPLQSSIRKH